YKLARIYENGKPLQAVETYNKLLKLTGPQWDVLLRQAELYEKLGSLEKAAGTIEKLREIDPGNSALEKMLVEFYVRTKEFDKAISVTDEMLEFSPEDIRLHELKAQVLIEKGDWDAASKEYNYMLAQPELPLDSKIKIGTAFFNRALTDSSLLPVAKNLFETLDKDTTDWQVKMFLGAIAMSQKEDSAAINYFKITTELAPWNAEAWIRLGGLYFDNQKYEEAIKVTSNAVKQFPDDYTLNLILGFSLAQREKHEEAYPYLKKAVELNPSDVNALSAYGYTLNQLKKSDEAIKYLKMALYLQPDNVNLLSTLGLIYNALKKYNDCDSVYARALQIDPENVLVNNNYAYSLSERGVRLDEALEMVKKSITAEPYNSSYLDTIGWVYYKLGKYEPAKENIEKAIKVGGERPVMLEHLGDVVFKLGEKEEALKFWQKALDLDNGNKELQLKIETGEI
ncbi:MAG: tetratricopeptide repeat protein, partial [Ignavibacteriaceae bacterium]|nr:tetratricopeptide repeat protein [Ignavibacteriaceae bacterium]